METGALDFFFSGSVAPLPSCATQRWSNVRWTAWGGLAYSTLGSIVLGYLVWNYGVKKIGGTRTGLYSNVTPIVAILFAWIALSETPRITQIAGAALIFTSITLTRKPHRRETKLAPARDRQSGARAT